LIGRKSAAPVAGDTYETVFELYSADGLRRVEVCRFAPEATYILESERDGGTYLPRHGGALVGPFKSARHAERFIVATAWFRGEGS
jgi:hypothetical protein